MRAVEEAVCEHPVDDWRRFLTDYDAMVREGMERHGSVIPFSDHDGTPYYMLTSMEGWRLMCDPAATSKACYIGPLPVESLFPNTFGLAGEAQEAKRRFLAGVFQEQMPGDAGAKHARLAAMRHVAQWQHAAQSGPIDLAPLLKAVVVDVLSELVLRTQVPELGTLLEHVLAYNANLTVALQAKAKLANVMRTALGVEEPVQLEQVCAAFAMAAYAGLSVALPSILGELFNDEAALKRARTAASSDDTAFLRAVVFEGLRLHPPVHFLTGHLLADVEVDGHRLAAGSRVKANVYYALRRSEELFPDPEAFVPDRFMGEESVQRRHPEALYMFAIGEGHGGRGCPGRDYALVVLTQVLAAVLRHADFEAEPADWDMRNFQLCKAPVRLRVRQLQASPAARALLPLQQGQQSVAGLAPADAEVALRALVEKAAGHDDFFGDSPLTDVGLTSLQVLGLKDAIEGHFGQNVEMAQLLGASVADLAAQLSSLAAAAGDPIEERFGCGSKRPPTVVRGAEARARPALHVLREARPGELTVVLLPGLAAPITSFSHYVSWIRRSHPEVGFAFLTDGPMMGMGSYFGMEDLAASLFEVLLRELPGKPVALLGLSFGGLVAINLARLLESSGEEEDQGRRPLLRGLVVLDPPLGYHGGRVRLPDPDDAEELHRFAEYNRSIYKVDADDATIAETMTNGFSILGAHDVCAGAAITARTWHLRLPPDFESQCCRLSDAEVRGLFKNGDERMSAAVTEHHRELGETQASAKEACGLLEEAIRVHRLYEAAAVPREPGWSWSPAGELPEVQHHHVPVGRGTVVHVAVVEPPVPPAVERAPILFMHSVAGCSFLFLTHIRELGQDRRAMAMDVRGWGETVTPPEQAIFTAKDVAEDIAGLLDFFGESRVILFGDGMGAAMAFAAAQLIPERIAAMSNMSKGYRMFDHWGGPSPPGMRMGPLAKARYYGERGEGKNFGYLLDFADPKKWPGMDDHIVRVIESMHTEFPSHDARAEHLASGRKFDVYEPRPQLREVWLKGAELNPFCSMLRLYRGVDESWQQMEDAPEPARLPLFSTTDRETSGWDSYFETVAERFQLTTVHYDVAPLTRAHGEVMQGDLVKRLRQWANETA